MSNSNQHLDNLSEIRSIMERSSKFISLSGISGVIAGLSALLGAFAGYQYLTSKFSTNRYYDYAYLDNGKINIEFFQFFFLDALGVFILALILGSYFTIRKAKKSNQQIWNQTSKRLLINLLIPLATGGIFCFILLYHGVFGLIAPSMLIFYGLALINASKYTLNDIRYLGITEIILGLISCFIIGYGLYFWAIGFGVLHIIYGLIMYFKYDRA